MEKQIMTTKEVAEYLGISEWEVRRLADEKILKSLRGFRKPKKFSFHKIKAYLDGE
jgi:excisionase family DNA binding protein